MPIKYQNPHFNPEKLSRHHIDRQAVTNVPPNSLVLDIGCATGFMGQYLKKAKNCTVLGLDLRPAEIRVAQKNLDQAIVGSIEDPRVITQLLALTKGQKFDVILATSLIEHIADPNLVIQYLKKLLRPQGKIIMSTPNIAHWSIRWQLLSGRFDYTDYGIMDNTHLHFFTLRTFRELFEKNGLSVNQLSIDAEGGGWPRLSLLLAPLWPGLFAYQMLVVATKPHKSK